MTQRPRPALQRIYYSGMRPEAGPVVGCEHSVFVLFRMDRQKVESLTRRSIVSEHVVQASDRDLKLRLRPVPGVLLALRGELGVDGVERRLVEALEGEDLRVIRDANREIAVARPYSPKQLDCNRPGVTLMPRQPRALDRQVLEQRWGWRAPTFA